MKHWEYGMAAGFGSIALFNSLIVLKHLPWGMWGMPHVIEVIKLLVLAGLLGRWLLLRDRRAYPLFVAGAVISSLTDWAWLSTLH